MGTQVTKYCKHPPKVNDRESIYTIFDDGSQGDVTTLFNLHYGPNTTFGKFTLIAVSCVIYLNNHRPPVRHFRDKGQEMLILI